jgi:8-oxo-dGTP pyrophosphatase MutT (NUDIX family)
MRQVAALPYRFAGHGSGEALEVLLVTSFRSGRWIIPKGNVDGDMPPHLAAAKEAEEEGGVCGRIGEQPIGCYCYGKLRFGTVCTLEVDVFPLEVREELADWPEMSIRERRWLPIEEAAEAVGEQDLAAIMRTFRP